MNAYTTTYQQQQVQTASQEQILIMLYDGAIRFLNQAKAGIAEKNIEKTHNNLIKVQRIIMEFMTSLDMEMGGEMAKNLSQLYEYLHYQLVQANLKKDVTMVDEVLMHLRELKKTWEEAITLSKLDQQEERALEDHDVEERRAYSA